MESDNNEQGFEVADQSVISTRIDAFAGIANIAFAAYFFIKLKKERHDTILTMQASNSSQSVFLKSITWATCSMLVSILFSTMRCVQDAEILLFNNDIFQQNFFQCNPKQCTLCDITERLSQIAVAILIALHFLIFAQSISDSFGRAHFIALNKKMFRFIQVVVIAHAIAVICAIGLCMLHIFLCLGIKNNVTINSVQKMCPHT